MLESHILVGNAAVGDSQAGKILQRLAAAAAVVRRGRILLTEVLPIALAIGILFQPQVQAVYTDATAGISFNLASGTVDGSAAGTGIDTLVNVEGIVGTKEGPDGGSPRTLARITLPRTQTTT